MPGNLKGVDLENFIRDAATTFSHETCTAKMGRDSMSVVDGYLKVYGIDHLRIADGSIMPRVTAGNTMAPCVIIGERASEILKAEYKIDLGSRICNMQPSFLVKVLIGQFSYTLTTIQPRSRSK
jgi:choline dehydrogenase